MTACAGGGMGCTEASPCSESPAAPEDEPDYDPFAGEGSAGATRAAGQEQGANDNDADTEASEATEESDYDPFAADGAEPPKPEEEPRHEEERCGATVAAAGQEVTEGDSGAGAAAGDAAGQEEYGEVAGEFQEEEEAMGGDDECAFGDLIDLLQAAGVESASADIQDGGLEHSQPDGVAAEEPVPTASHYTGAATAPAEAATMPAETAAPAQAPRAPAPRGAGGLGFVIETARPLDAGEPERPKRAKRQVEYQFNARTQRWEPVEKPQEPKRPTTAPSPAAAASTAMPWPKSATPGRPAAPEMGGRGCPADTPRVSADPRVGGPGVARATAAGVGDVPKQCRNYLLGVCSFGARCRFAHGEHESRGGHGAGYSDYTAPPQQQQQQAASQQRDPRRRVDHLAEVKAQAREDTARGLCEHSQALAVRLALRFEAQPTEILGSLAKAGLPAAKDQRSTVKAIMRLCHPDKCKHPEAKKAMQILQPLLTS